MRKVILSRQKLNVIGVSGSNMERGDYVHHGEVGGGAPSLPPPLNVVTHNGVPVTHNGEYVTYGA